MATRISALLTVVLLVTACRKGEGKERKAEMCQLLKDVSSSSGVTAWGVGRLQQGTASRLLAAVATHKADPHMGGGGLVKSHKSPCAHPQSPAMPHSPAQRQAPQPLVAPRARLLYWH